MRPFVRQVISLATVIGYFLAITWGSSWHDHCHSHSHGKCSEAAGEDGHAHSHGHSHVHGAHHHGAHCSHHSESSPQPCDPTAHQRGPTHAPRHAPGHDDDCPVCQLLAQPPLAAPVIELVVNQEPVREWTISIRPQACESLPAAYDSRGPPMA